MQTNANYARKWFRNKFRLSASLVFIPTEQIGVARQEDSGIAFEVMVHSAE
jgi:hypothetical protein